MFKCLRFVVSFQIEIYIHVNGLYIVDIYGICFMEAFKLKLKHTTCLSLTKLMIETVGMHIASSLIGANKFVFHAQILLYSLILKNIRFTTSSWSF